MISKLFTSLLIFFVVFFSFSTTIFARDDNSFIAEIIEIVFEDENYQVLRVIDNKALLYEVNNGSEFIGVRNKFQVGDKIIVNTVEDLEGDVTYLATDYFRNDGLLGLFALFILFVVAIGGVYGAFSVVGMAFSFLVIFKLILPMIFSGQNAVLSAIIGAVLIVPVTFSLSHGLKRKTLIAIVSTTATLLLTGLVATFFVNVTHLSGFAAEESSFLLTIAGDTLNFKGILLAGIIIATLGVLDDITISQASIVEELKSANKKLSNQEIFTKAMNVGRDHISSLVNTLVLVYTGASLPLLLLFTNSGLSYTDAINYEIVAEEVVRMLVGSIGLVLAVPITTLIAVYFKADK